MSPLLDYWLKLKQPKASSATSDGSSSWSSLWRVFIELGLLGVLLLIAIAINLRMLRDGLNGLGDLRWHLTWLQHFSKQLSEGIWYPRWLAGTNFGYGSPTFVFYPPLVAYIGSGLKILGLSFEQTVVTLFSGGIFCSGLSFYVFARHHWGKLPALFGGLAYMLTPGVIVVTNGGGLASLYGFIWAPLLLWCTDKAVRQSSYRIVLPVIWALSALTHLPSFLMYVVGWSAYSLKLLAGESWTTRLQIWLCAPLGWGLASFFLVPAILEQRYINIDYMLASQAGFQSAMPKLLETARQGLASIAVRQWLACFVLAAIAWVGCAQTPTPAKRSQESLVPSQLPAKRAQQRCYRRTALGLLLTAVFIIFLIHDWSWPLWKLNPTLQKIESSGRVARLLYMTEAALCAVAVRSILSHTGRFKRLSQGICLTIVCAILLSNFKYGYQLVRQTPGLYSAGNGVVWNRPWLERIIHDPYSDGLIDVPEYRPRLVAAASSTYVKESHSQAGLPEARTMTVGALPTPQPQQPKVEVVTGAGRADILSWHSYHRRLRLQASSQVTYILRIYSYPGWRLYLDGQAHPIRQSADGRIQLQVEPGTYIAEVVYEKTLAFKLGIATASMSTVAFFGLSVLWWRRSQNRCRDAEPVSTYRS